MTMPRYRSRMALRPIQRIKHVTDASATIASGVQFTVNLVAANDAPVIGSTAQVITGSKVYGIYLKVVVASNEAQVTGAIPNVYMMIFKNPGGNLTLPSANAVGASDNKRFSIHQEMSMITNIVSAAPTVLFDGVIKIPKGLSRFGPNDLLTIAILAPAIDISFCSQTHYKEFR